MAVTCLFQLIDPLSGLDSHMKETQNPSHDVDNSVRNLSRGADVTNVSIGKIKHEGLHKLAGNMLGELWGGIETCFSSEAIKLLKGQI